MTSRFHRNPFDQFDNRPSQLPVGECRIGLQQAERMRVRDERERRLDALLGGLFDMVVSLEEGIDGYLETPCDLRETTGADAIRSLLVLLHLLKRHPDALAELGL